MALLANNVVKGCGNQGVALLAKSEDWGGDRHTSLIITSPNGEGDGHTSLFLTIFTTGTNR